MAGAKLLLVMGHTRCGAVNAAVRYACLPESAGQATGCQHLDRVVGDIQKCIDHEKCQQLLTLPPNQQQAYVDEIARRNVRASMQSIMQHSNTLRDLVMDGRLMIAGGMYNVTTGHIDFI